MRISSCVRTSCIFLLLVFSPFEARSQTQQSSSAGNVPSAESRDAAQDARFLSLIKLRDGQLVSIGELRRIVSYHDNLKGRLEAFSFGADISKSRDQLTKAITNELDRLKKFDDDVKAERELSGKITLTNAFDGSFPIRILPEKSGRGLPSIFRNLGLGLGDEQPSLPTQRERTTAKEVFQNVSLENRDWSARYDRIFAYMDQKLADLRLKAPRLETLPTQFSDLVGAPSIDEMTEVQIQLGIEQYRAALTATRTDIASITQATDASVKAELTAQVDAIGRDLVGRSTEANTELKNIEKTISTQARSLYQNKVGADSFNYLLIVFAGVFLVIMIAPKFYPEVVAVNVLKSEFLLQFSTVFVLIAAIIILGIGELIKPDQLPVLLAGISGYVLGQLGKA